MKRIKKLEISSDLILSDEEQNLILGGDVTQIDHTHACGALCTQRYLYHVSTDYAGVLLGIAEGIIGVGTCFVNPYAGGVAIAGGYYTYGASWGYNELETMQFKAPAGTAQIHQNRTYYKLEGTNLTTLH